MPPSEPQKAADPAPGILRPPEQILDGNLLLRRWQPGDVDAIYASVNASLPELSKWMPWCSNGYSREDAATFISITQDNWRTGEDFSYAVIVDGGPPSGSFGLMSRAGPGGKEMGYWLATELTGRGLATRIARILTKVAFEDLKAGFVLITHSQDNPRSGAIPKRLGYTFLGERPPTEKEKEEGGPREVIVMWQLDRPAKEES